MEIKIQHKSKYKFLVLILFMLSFFSNAMAAGESDFPPNYYDIIALMLLLIIVLTFLSMIFLEGKPKTEAKKESRIIVKLRQILTRSVPVEREKEILFEHSYDGIQELDSKVPPWFTWLFYLTILFGIYYMLHYHVFKTGPLMYDEYNEEMVLAAAAKQELMATGALVNEETVTQLTDPADLQTGKQIFETNCIACHAADGGGIVGPNLTDKYWIHGGGIKNVFKTIKYGVPAKGMISWQTQLNAKQIQDVASFVLSLQGTKPAAPKNPEGELWVDPEETSEKM